MMGSSHLSNILDFTCFLLSEQHISTNYFNVSFYIEFLYEMLTDQHANTLIQVIANNEVALENLLFGLIKFYSLIATTGRHNQYYEKFTYHYKTNKIMGFLLKQKAYQLKLKAFLRDLSFQKFINHTIANTTHFIDEIN